MKFLFKIRKYLLSAVALVLLVYVGVSAFPEPMFAHHIVYKNYDIWSDKPIPPQINQVLDDVSRRLDKSDLQDKNARYKIFFCNASWRLWLYGQHFSDQVGADADTLLTRNIYVRASDIGANRLIAPGGGALADAARRPLSYFIAHEAAHIIVARQFGRLVSIRYPLWLMEGYADYVGKGNDFDFDDNYRLFRMQSPTMDFPQSGLYRGFHLRLAVLLDKSGMTARQIFDHPPSEETMNELFENYAASRK
jgi:hypothetical protein